MTDTDRIDLLEKLIVDHDVGIFHAHYDPAMPICIRCTGPTAPGGMPDIDVEGETLREALNRIASSGDNE